MDSKFETGDHLWVQCMGYTHHGLATSDCSVVHYIGKGSLYTDGIILETGFAEFAEGAEIRRKHHQTRVHDAVASVRRARGRLGESAYNLITNNCEHLVTWCIQGEEESTQVRKAVVAVAANHLARPVVMSVATGTLLGLGAPVIVPALATAWVTKKIIDAIFD